jgi:putative FmdB family regulatory protein
MPIYEYGCVTCDKSIEVTRSINDTEQIPQCPSCGYNMVRAYNSFGIQFKGTGFYKTDNAK